MQNSGDFAPRAGLSVHTELLNFLEQEALPRTTVKPDAFWNGFSSLIEELAPRNRELLAERVRLQELIDEWHRNHFAQPIDPNAYQLFLTEIGYLRPVGLPFTIDTDNVDPEIATVAGPQLVVPITNARYALNAANARWGSLYDALYGTDALGTANVVDGYDPVRGAAVIAWGREFLDDVVPLSTGSHAHASKYLVCDGSLVVQLHDGNQATLADTACFVGYSGPEAAPSTVMLSQHGLGIELVFAASTEVGRTDRAGISDVIIESALTTIIDFEDSVAVIDAADKVGCYRNWLGLMTEELVESVSKAGRTFTRGLTPDRTLTAPDGSACTVRSRALLLVRNVGHLMTTPAVLDSRGAHIPEGLLDAMITVLIATADNGTNSRTGSIYIVKPKMHGPDEVAFAAQTFTLIEQALGLAPNTVKIGIMDEERRTTVNLTECIRAAKSRVAFINTGFLDRTGDEIHTSMQAGPMLRKAEMKQSAWMKAYEDCNVDVGLACGLQGRAQIGKGMWAAPELMAGMLAEKIAQPMAGASCGWVPSPTAATLHATHYHRVDVRARQAAIAAGGPRATLADLLQIPVQATADWTPAEIQQEIENNVQGILGYVVRWINQGVGCSKVPDINGVELMEDRATCRISSQHLANWLRHDIASLDQIDTALRKMAQVVDVQNATEADYKPMGPRFDGPAFTAARELILDGAAQPSGYTEPILHRKRQLVKGRRIS